MVDGEDAVEVIHLVLDEFGEGAFGLEDAVFASNSLITKHHSPMALKTDH